MIERRVLYVVDAKNGIERAALAFMREFHAIDVVGYPARLLSDGKDLVLRDVDERCIGIDEAPDQPGTGDTVDLRMFSRHPLAWGRPDVAPRRQSLVGPAGNAAFQDTSPDPHQP